MRIGMADHNNRSSSFITALMEIDYNRVNSFETRSDKLCSNQGLLKRRQRPDILVDRLQSNSAIIWSASRACSRPREKADDDG